MAIEKEKFDLSAIKMALEHASFSNFKVREGVLDLIKNVELDMEDVGLEPSEQTKDCIGLLVNTLNEFEAPRKPKKLAGEFHLDEIDVSNIREIEPDISKDITKVETTDQTVRVRKIVNVDEELEGM